MNDTDKKPSTDQNLNTENINNLDQQEISSATSTSVPPVDIGLLEFIARIIDTLVWPLLIGFLFFLIRKPIKKLISGIQTFKYGGAEFDFGEKIEQLTSNAQSLGVTAIYPETTFEAKKVEDVIDNPEMAIITAWIDIEESIRNWANQEQIDIKNNEQHGVNLINILRSHKAVNPDLLRLLESVRTIRNQVAHKPIKNDIEEGAQITKDEALHWLSIMKSINERLNFSLFD